MAMQIGFTVAVHLRAVPAVRDSDAVWWIGGQILLVAAALVVAQNKWSAGLGVGDRQMYAGDLIYRLFMSFYGLVFPAYVWVCMIPWRKGRGTGRWSLVACGIVVLVAAPFYWFGFILERMYWLVPAVGIVLAGGPLRWVLPAGNEPADAAVG
jgi:hypothetical protein